jgi:hypothetical protein
VTWPPNSGGRSRQRLEVRRAPGRDPIDEKVASGPYPHQHADVGAILLNFIKPQPRVVEAIPGCHLVHRLARCCGLGQIDFGRGSLVAIRVTATPSEPAAIDAACVDAAAPPCAGWLCRSLSLLTGKLGV